MQPTSPRTLRCLQSCSGSIGCPCTAAAINNCTTVIWFAVGSQAAELEVGQELLTLDIRAFPRQRASPLGCFLLPLLLSYLTLSARNLWQYSDRVAKPREAAFVQSEKSAVHRGELEHHFKTRGIQ